VSEDTKLSALLDRGYRYALSLTHDPALAEDLVQEAWLAILRRGAPRHVGYLFATIRNRFIDQVRRRRVRGLPEDFDEEMTTADGSPHHNTLMIVQRLSMERALSQIRPEGREVVYLSLVEGYTVSEVAQLTARPRGTIASLLRRARQKLCALLSITDETPDDLEAL